MKFIWETKDIVAGRYACKNVETKDIGFLASVSYKIGYKGGAGETTYHLIALSDGMIGLERSKEFLANRLNADNFRPMPQNLIMKVIEELREVNENGNS